MLVKEKKKKSFSDGIKRLDTGAYLVRLRIDGKPVEKRFPTKQEALDFRETVRKKKLARSLGMELPSAPILPKCKTLGEVLDAYSAECRINGRSKSLLSNIRVARKLVSEWRGLGASAELRRADFVDLILWIDKNRPKATRRSLHSHAITLIRTAMKISDIPLPHVPALALPAERKQRTIKPEELAKLLDALKENSVERVAAYIGLFTGARQEETLRLKFEDVDLDAGIIRLTRMKRRRTARPKVTTNPIHPVLEKILRSYLETVPKGLPADAPFLGLNIGRGKKTAPWHGLNPDTLSYRIKTACKKAGIEVHGGLGFMRHQFATLSRESGSISLEEAAKALSHASTGMTERHYDESAVADRVAFEASLKAAEAVSQALGMNPEQGEGAVN